MLVAFGVMLAVQHRDEPSVPRLVQRHEPVPQFHLTTLDGKTIDTKSLAGKTYVVNFFNSWCIPCQQEAPALQAFYDAHKNEHDFEMIGVVRDDEETAVRDYVDGKQGRVARRARPAPTARHSTSARRASPRRS